MEPICVSFFLRVKPRLFLQTVLVPQLKVVRNFKAVGAANPDGAWREVDPLAYLVSRKVSDSELRQ